MGRLAHQSNLLSTDSVAASRIYSIFYNGYYREWIYYIYVTPITLHIYRPHKSL